MAKPVYPTFDIHNLVANKSHNDLLNADRFKRYLSSNPHLGVVHNHAFYHLVYFTEGSGEHVIDFVTFPVQKGMIYFMRPGQVHKWYFNEDADGYIVNFSATFFDQLFINSSFIDQFSFFDQVAAHQVLLLKEDTQRQVEQLFEKILCEQSEKPPSSQLMIATLLLQLFLTVERNDPKTIKEETAGYNSVILRNFKRLIEDNFKTIRLPKGYAALLYITPNHLNALCKDYLGISAGEVIRNRIILEARRLLINFDLSVGDIAQELNFPDNSYFVKFFKKYTHSTPEAFRNKNYKQR
ncbi:helix-turn-helix transcriptional regulator [Agriterribacter sp.]|uniref:AraC family transcriptional regulator n=1 Tax=Agriterribacter sp. TaxID=2821509 RepID=UPI002C45CC97|nr:helix-turn-helix transcriptional regulator [Agriterribacter sp.]HRO45320.1 helix-turn-helix transcriptional regulator [Agriterribacter sp.]HRQ17119.1 helix-turn-helix transcriptional regulator [Agriterribacter sp.]